METIRLPRMMQDISIKEKSRGKSIGLVPTMGALHDGHMGLLRAARAENDIVVASIFVNPAQFGEGEDFNKYPRDLGADREKLEKAEIDVLFMPEGEAVYPQGYCTWVDVDGLSEKMCGQFRPGHFRGVATIVLKLFNMALPTRAYFGQKDYQQALIVRRLAKDMDIPIEIVICPTVRETDGLALSSRNSYLSKEEREAAPVIYRALLAAAENFKSGVRNRRELANTISSTLKSEPLVKTIEYASAFDSESLEEPEMLGSSVLFASAVRIGSTRLIDNLLANDLK